MLDFSEEEKNKLGLNQSGWVRYIPILGKRFQGGSDQKKDKDSLSELWVQFLLNQIQDTGLDKESITSKEMENDKTQGDETEVGDLEPSK